MSENIIESYLVSIGWRVEQAQFQQVEVALKKMDHAVEQHLGGMIESMAKWTSSIIGAFAAVGGATLGMMDKMATADQDFRLFAESMFMSEPAARKLKLATDALGYSLDQIAWDPELSARLDVLLKDQSKMDALARSADVATGLKGIRDAGFEFTRLKVEFQEIATIASGKLFHDLGGEGLVASLQRMNDWIQQHLPEIEDWLEKYFVPILRDVERVGEDVWRVMEALALAFVHLMGALTRDRTLEDGAVNFDNLGKSIDKAADFLVRFVDAVTSAVEMVTDLFDALLDLLHLDFKDFARDLKELGHDTTAGGAGVLGYVALAGLLGAKTPWGLLGKLLGIGKAGLGGLAEGAGAELAAGGVGAGSAVAATGGVAALGAGLFFGAKAFDEKWGTALRKSYGFSDDAEDNFRKFLGLPRESAGGGSLIDDAARRYGVDPALAHAVARQESGERQYDGRGNLITSRTGAQGMFQIEPWTAKALGIDAADTSQNVDGGLHLLSTLMARYGNSAEALAAYNWGEKNLDRALAKHNGQFSLDYLPAETRNYVQSIESKTAGDVSIGDVNVHITHSDPKPHEISKAVAAGVRDGVNKQTQSNLTNLQGAYS